MTHVCITNDLPDFRSCTVRDEHKSHCDGFQHQYSPVARREVILDVECTGCLPAPAELGRWCYSHVAKLDDALHETPAFVAILWDAQSNGVRDDNSGGGHVAAGPSWPLLESRTQASWIVGSMLNAVRVLDGEDRDLTFLDNRAVPVRASTREIRYIASTYARILDVGRDELGKTKLGAESAVRYIDLLQRAMRRFPTRERARRIAGIRCEHCQHADLIWKPPLAHLADVIIKCRNCDAEYPQSWLEQWSDLLQLRGDDDAPDAV